MPQIQKDESDKKLAVENDHLLAAMFIVDEKWNYRMFL